MLAAGIPELGIGFVGVSLAFGLTVLTMAYAVGHISGGHFNPAVTVGLWVSGRFPAGHILPYWIAQIVGAIAAAGVLYLIASGKAGFDLSDGFASNGFGEHSPQGYSMTAALLAKIVLTAFFSDHHSWRDGRKSTGRLCANRYRPRPDPHSPDQHSCYQYLGKSGAEPWTGRIRRRMGHIAALAFLGRRDWRRDLPLAGSERRKRMIAA